MTVRVVKADNPSPLTLDGSRSYVVGLDDVAIIDPGPPDERHLDRIDGAVAGRPVRAILLTHAHADHSGSAGSAAARFGAPIRASAETLRRTGLAGGPMAEGDRIDLGGGLGIVAIRTPGHSADHLSFLLLPARDVFTGDLVLGTGTSVILYPDGDLADYLASLARLVALRPSRLWPGHGDAVEDGSRRLAEYRQHRLERSRQIVAAVAAGARTVAEIRVAVYEELPAELEFAAEASISAHLDHLRAAGADVPSPDPAFTFDEAGG